MRQALLLTLLVFLSSLASAEQADRSRYYVPTVPGDLSQVDFYLLTGGIGADLASRYGHTGIRVVDPNAGTDVVYNWGKFNFEEGNFAWKFFRGNVTYSMGVRNYTSDIAIYERAGRALWEEKLNLTNSQKRRLYERIAVNSVPENRNFKYQYWYKNCATIPRDYIDEVLGGQVKARFTVDAGKTFRDYVRSNLATIPFVVPLLDLFMNSNIDRPISKWEEMFKPSLLREYLLAMPQVDDLGKVIPGTQLLTGSRTLVDNPELYDPLVPDFFLMTALAAVPLVLAGVGVLTRRRSLAWRCFGTALLLWGILAGTLGSTLVLNWAFSGHADGWRNVNSMLFLPVDFLFAIAGWRILKEGGPVKDRFVFAGSGRALAMLHVALLTLWCGLATAGLIQQNIWQVAAWFGIPMFVVSLATLRCAFTAAPAGAKQPAAAVVTPAVKKRNLQKDKMAAKAARH